MLSNVTHALHPKPGGDDDNPQETEVMLCILMHSTECPDGPQSVSLLGPTGDTAMGSKIDDLIDGPQEGSFTGPKDYPEGPERDAPGRLLSTGSNSGRDYPQGQPRATRGPELGIPGLGIDSNR